jgi:hypothetical protein
MRLLIKIERMGEKKLALIKTGVYFFYSELENLIRKLNGENLIRN